MNKAFTRESDAGDDEDELEAVLAAAGRRAQLHDARWVRATLRGTRAAGHKDRPELVATVAWAAANGDRSENGDYIYGKKRLREIDRRIRFLMKRLDAPEVVDPPAPRDERAAGQVFFGATVTIRNGRVRAHRGHRRCRRDRYRARLHQLGVADGARAAQAREGDLVTLRTPGGAEDLDIIASAASRSRPGPGHPS